MKLDVLAFGVHPDDVELSCSGTLLVEKKAGKKVGVVDLTRGELGTRGTADTRESESKASTQILELDARENLGLADGFFKNDEEHQLKVIYAIRKYKPEVVLCNAPEDRHPDHGRSAELVSDASFLSGLMKIKTEDNGVEQNAWRPKYVLNYIQDRYLKPDFVVDISEVFEQKLESIKAYKTQFFQEGSGGVQTYISSPEFLESVIYRYKMFGKMIGVEYAEGFISKKILGIKSLESIIKNNT
ncbi:MAG: bacillithiol biosynthesis deacetylase BshB1 [Ferruginibacter sp.]